MKEFNLEQALAGEPVQLRNGKKTIIAINTKTLSYKSSDFPLIGFVVNDYDQLSEPKTWTLEGNYYETGEESNFDIVGMWEEPRPTVTLTLPCPLKESQKDMWFISGNYSVVKSSYIDGADEEKTVSTEMLEQGLYFATKEDAQAWLDALKDSRR